MCSLTTELLTILPLLLMRYGFTMQITIKTIDLTNLSLGHRRRSFRSRRSKSCEDSSSLAFGLTVYHRASLLRLQVLLSPSLITDWRMGEHTTNTRTEVSPPPQRPDLVRGSDKDENTTIPMMIGKRNDSVLSPWFLAFLLSSL